MNTGSMLGMSPVLGNSARFLLQFDLEIFRSELNGPLTPLAVFLSEMKRYRSIPASLDPLIIEDETWNSVVRASQAAIKGMNAIADLWRRAEYKERSRKIYSELSPIEMAAALHKPSALATARLDLFFDDAGLKIIEANCTIPAMQAYSDIIRNAWLSATGKSGHRSPNSEDLLQSLLFLYRKHGGSEKLPRIAIVARVGDSQLAELQYLRIIWARRGFESDIVQPYALKISGHKLIEASSGKSYGLIYRHIFANKLDEASDFAKACLENQNFHVYNPVSAHLEIKALFAELSHYADDGQLSSHIGLSAEERALLQKHLPWTRVLHRTAGSNEVDELKSLDPKSYVIKSSSGYGGHDVFIGSSFHEAEAQARLQKLVKTSRPVTWPGFIDFCASENNGIWIIQQRLKGHRMKHRFLYDNVLEQESYVDASLFAWAHSVPRGGASRFALDPIVNIGRGGGLLPMFLRSEYDSLLKNPGKQ